MRISDWSSDVCSSDLRSGRPACATPSPRRSACAPRAGRRPPADEVDRPPPGRINPAEPSAQDVPMTRTHVFSGSVFEENIGYARAVVDGDWIFVSGTTGFDYKARTISDRSEEHTSELQSLMRISYDVF